MVMLKSLNSNLFSFVKHDHMLYYFGSDSIGVPMFFCEYLYFFYMCICTIVSTFVFDIYIYIYIRNVYFRIRDVFDFNWVYISLNMKTCS